MADKLFNPPPGWPAPPAGWRPGPDWTPDPAWPPAPEGWPFFIRPDAHPWRWSFATSGSLYVVALVVLGLTAGFDAEAAGRLFAVVFLFPGLVCALIARTRGRYWAWWRYLLTIVALFIVFSTLSALGAAGNGGPDAERVQGRSGVISSGDVLLNALAVGDCVTSINDEVARTLPAVPCTQQHRVQVFGVFDIDVPEGAEYPGDQQVQRLADGGCQRRATESGINPDLELYNYFPSAESWPAPDRRVVCLFETDVVERDLLADALAKVTPPASPAP